MALSRRYQPSWSPGDDCVVGLDLSFIIPAGTGIQLASLKIWTNSANPQETSDMIPGPVASWGRTVYARLTGGVEGTDYQLRWQIVDGAGNIWNRVCLLLCSWTS